MIAGGKAGLNDFRNPVRKTEMIFPRITVMNRRKAPENRSVGDKESNKRFSMIGKFEIRDATAE